MGYAPRKRTVDVVDISSDDEDWTGLQRPVKTSRLGSADNLSRLSSGQRFGEDAAFVSLAQLPQVPGIDEEDADAANVIQNSQNGDESINTIHYGDLNTKIVGVRYYSGRATLGEHVIVVREPNNNYDRNAIRVLNVMNGQIGHIPRTMAAKLAPYMDSKSLVIEGILTSTIGHYECSVVLKLYGTADPIQRTQLKQKMQKDRLPVSRLVQAERDERSREKQREQARKDALKRARSLAKGKGQQWDNQDSAMFSNLSTLEGGIGIENLEDLIDQSSDFNPREIGKVVENFGQSESELANMPMADNPDGLVTQLLPYQRQGLAWMLSKESPSLPSPGSSEVVQLWKRDKNVYTNIATNFSTTQAPMLASGGILADDMGLGKTIQIISLILANSKPKSAASSKTTLIVSPVGVMSNWKDQIRDHTNPETAPRVLIYHGPGKKEASHLSDYDVVITSYGALAMDYDPIAKKQPGNGIFSLQWRRVVLDEGHTIRNQRSKGALAACNLRADSRWTLTGTPIVNSLKDLYSQVRFLKLSGGLSDFAVFNTVLIRPLTYNEASARLLLQALMGTICLRRRKDMNFVNLRLPPMTSRILRVKFHPHEQEKYEMFQNEAKGVFLDYQSGSKTGSATYSHLLEVILRLRQVCNHWALCKNRIDKLTALLEEHKVVQLTPENVKALQDMLQLRIESQEVCPICLDILEQPVITACAHAFCRGCIEQVIERQHKCPLCRAELEDASTLVSPSNELGEDSNEVVVSPDQPSSKIEALVKILTAHGQASGTKTVVFSQWTSFLDLIEPHLHQHGIGFARIDGKMNSTKRDNSTHAFSNDPDCKVLLASLSVCSVGLNLVAANQAILADSWWAPAIEDQAVDRVYRLGQKRETTVWRLVMEDSIEDRVLEVQDTKRKLMLEAFREKAAKKVEDRATRVADLGKLLR